MVSNQETYDNSTCDGSLSSSEFQIAASVFAQKWNNVNHSLPECSWIDCSNRLGITAHGVRDGYLSLENVFLQRFNQEEHDEDSSNDNEEPSCSDKEEPFDNATLVLNNGGNGHHYTFHVVYSRSYRVPVLYFRAYCTDGQPLNKDEIEKDLPTTSVDLLLESKWTFITQEEHPYLNRPWYTLHPCGTSEWMKLLLAADNSTAKHGPEQYLVSWFSVVGQVFGLKLPIQMLKSISY